mmetsp:Transcript_41069/g.39583  ORF Transcript_41069/g.39583 Transcript_41069/m.39583 type:complete len:329 (-) Transcript_41069:15-1001(-)
MLMDGQVRVLHHEAHRIAQVHKLLPRCKVRVVYLLEGLQVGFQGVVDVLLPELVVAELLPALRARVQEHMLVQQLLQRLIDGRADASVFEFGGSDPDEDLVELVAAEGLVRVVFLLQLLQDHIRGNEQPVDGSDLDGLVEEVALLTEVREVDPRDARERALTDLRHVNLLDQLNVVLDHLHSLPPVPIILDEPVQLPEPEIIFQHMSEDGRGVFLPVLEDAGFLLEHLLELLHLAHLPVYGDVFFSEGREEFVDEVLELPFVLHGHRVHVLAGLHEAGQHVQLAPSLMGAVHCLDVEEVGLSVADVLRDGFLPGVLVGVQVALSEPAD